MAQFLGILLLIAQFYFIYHALIRKRYFWAIGIFIIPFLGCLAYFMLKFWPEFQNSSVASEAGSSIESFFFPEKELQSLKDEFERSPSFSNKIALAEGLQKSGQFSEAINLYETSLSGFNNDDPTLWQGLSHAYFQEKRFEEARDAVKKLRVYREGNKVDDFDLILAKSLVELEQKEEAVKEYEYISDRYAGEEARCRYAQLLKELGREEEAKDIFKEILNHSRLSPPHYRRQHQEWIAIASKELDLR